jgi:hypothetical protein
VQAAAAVPWSVDTMANEFYAAFGAGRNRYGAQWVHLTPQGRFLCISVPWVWCIPSAAHPLDPPWLRGPLSPFLFSI